MTLPGGRGAQWRDSEVQLAAGVLAILVVAPVVIALDPFPGKLLYTAALFVIMDGGIATLVAAFVMEPKKGPDRPVNERALDRYMNLIVLFMAFAVATTALLFSAGRLDFALLICGAAIVWSLAWLPSVTRRIGVQTQVFINRHPKTVFSFMLDGRNQMQYVPDLVSVEKITDGDIGPGTQFRTKVRLDGAGDFEGVEEIVDVG